MDQGKVVIIGAGHVGSHCAYALAASGVCGEIVLVDNAAEKVMEVTEEIVTRDKITTLMITHDMDYALSVGDRTIMLDAGRVVLDLSGEERENMTPGALAELFYARSRRKKSD